jgi:hypothetical protein
MHRLFADGEGLPHQTIIPIMGCLGKGQDAVVAPQGGMCACARLRRCKARHQPLAGPVESIPYLVLWSRCRGAVILGAFVKKTEKTPTGEIEVALERAKELKP